MAFGGLKTAHLSSPKHFNPSHLFQFLLLPTIPSHQTLLPPPIQFHSNSNYSPNTRSVAAQELSAVFSKHHPSLLDNTHLQNLAEKLTPETVETVLKDLKGWRTAHQFFSWAAQQDGFVHNRYTYNTMASILSRARQESLLKILAKDVVNHSCPMSPGALGFLFRCLGSQGLIDEAQYLFDNAKRLTCVPNTYTYNCLLEALAKSGRVELVESRFKEMVGSGREPDKFTLMPVLQAYCNAGKFEQALAVFDRIYNSGWADEHVFTVLVVSFSKWGEVDKAFKLIERMERLGMRLNEKTLCVLIHGFTKERRVDKALVLFDRIKEFGFERNLALYSVLIGGLCVRKDLNKALDLYWEMKELGIFPDVGVIKKMILAFCGEGEMITAERILEEDGEKLDVDALVLLFNAVLEGLTNHGEVDKARLLIQAMMESQEVHPAQGKAVESVIDDITEAVTGNLFRFKKVVLPNAASFNIVIDGLCKTQKLDMALELLRDMVVMGCAGNVLIYNNLIHELCNVDRLDESYELLRKMKESGFEPTHFTYNSIFGCLCRRENLSGALDLVIEMRRNGHEPWIKHCTMLVKQLCEGGKVMDACSFLNDMVRAGFLPNIIAYTAAMKGLFKAGEVDQALKLFRSMFVNQYLPDVVAHNIVIDGLCKAERAFEAQEIVKEMLEKGLVPSVVTYNSMIDGWCKSDRIDLALLCFSRMVEEGKLPTIFTYTTLIDGMCNASRPDDALILWNEMKEKGCELSKISYVALVNGLCKCGREEAALVYFREMEEKELEVDTFVYVALLNSFISKGNLIFGFQLLKEMVRKLKFPSPTDKNYPLLIDALRKLYEDENTFLDVQNLIVEGLVPSIHSVHDLGTDIKET